MRIFPFYIAVHSVDYTLNAMLELLIQVYYLIRDNKITFYQGGDRIC